MSQVVFLPGFDGEAQLRSEFTRALARDHELRAVTYPARALGTLDAYREFAMAQAPVDWNPVLVAESFSGLVAARWASVDPRVRALVLCAAFARNPVGPAALLGAYLPEITRLGPAFMGPFARISGDPRRAKWAEGLARVMGRMNPSVVAERLRIIATDDVSPVLASLAIPIVVVQFEGDVVVGRHARAHLESVCENVHVLNLPGPHFALATRPAETAAAITARLGSLFPAASDA